MLKASVWLMCATEAAHNRSVFGKIVIERAYYQAKGE